MRIIDIDFFTFPHSNNFVYVSLLSEMTVFLFTITYKIKYCVFMMINEIKCLQCLFTMMNENSFYVYDNDECV